LCLLRRPPEARRGDREGHRRRDDEGLVGLREGKLRPGVGREPPRHREGSRGGHSRVRARERRRQPRHPRFAVGLMPLYTYDVSKVLVTVAFPLYAGPLEGLAEGTFVRVARNAPLVRYEVGVDAEVTKVVTERKDGWVEFTVEDASPFQLFLGMVTDRALTGTILVKDANSVLDLAFCSEATFVGQPPCARGSEAGQTTWRAEAGTVDIKRGGHLPADGRSFLDSPTNSLQAIFRR